MILSVRESRKESKKAMASEKAAIRGEDGQGTKFKDGGPRTLKKARSDPFNGTRSHGHYKWIGL
jgi:hypothetical protein